MAFKRGAPARPEAKDVDVEVNPRPEDKKIENFEHHEGDFDILDVATPAEEAAVIRKLDRRLLPLVFVLYTFAVLDRSNLGNARLAGMAKDINLSGDRYNMLGTIFYIAYIISQWTIIGWKQFKPHYFASATVMLWGLDASLQATAFNWSGLMACRFFLGVFEAMFGPGVPLYLTYFYPRENIGLRQGVFIAGAAAANAYGGALAYGISQIRGSLAPWRILFLIEGLPTCAVAVATFFLLPDNIRTAKFLTEREKQIAHAFVARNQQSDAGHETGVRLSQLLAAFKDPKSFLPAMMYFGCNVSYASLPLFLPTIISEMGAFTTIQSNGLSAPPYVLCFFFILLICWLSDRYRKRGPFVAIPALLAGIGFIINATTTTAGPRYFSTFLSVLIFASVAILLAWTANMNSSDSKRGGGYIILGLIGQCGPVLGTNVFPPSERPFYRKGMWISAAMCLMVASIAVILSCWLIYENRRMDREEQEGIANVVAYDGEAAKDDVGHAGKANPQPVRFRYVW